MHHRRHVALGIDPHRHDGVVQLDRAALDGGSDLLKVDHRLAASAHAVGLETERPLFDGPGSPPHWHHCAHNKWGRVRHDGFADNRCQARERAVDQFGRLQLDRGVRLLRLTMHPPDGGPRQDVVELKREQRLPQPIECCRRVAAASVAPVRCDAPHFGLSQQRLAPAVARFGRGLRGVGASMHFEIELPHPPRGVAVLLDRRVEHR